VLLAAADRAGSPYDRFAASSSSTSTGTWPHLGVGASLPCSRGRTASIGQVYRAGGGAARPRGPHTNGTARSGSAVPPPRVRPCQIVDLALRLAAEIRGRPGRPGQGRPFDVAVLAGVRERGAGAGPAVGQRPARLARECAAMALHAFGPAVDVQAGGGDLGFPHHAYQAALAEAFTGVTPFARSRLNAGVVRVAGAKMAKSAGNLVLVSDLLKEIPRPPSGF